MNSFDTQLCRRLNGSELFVFGSVLRDTFNEGSDIDFVVDFKFSLEKLLISQSGATVFRSSVIYAVLLFENLGELNKSDHYKTYRGQPDRQQCGYGHSQPELGVNTEGPFGG
jgi:hypothetical protein